MGFVEQWRFLLKKTDLTGPFIAWATEDQQRFVAVVKKQKILIMSLTLNAFRTKLLAKILNSRSQSEVKRFIDVAIKSMKRHLINGHIISRFIEKTLQELQQMSPMDHDAQQWSNINMARIEFKQWIKAGHSNS